MSFRTFSIQVESINADFDQHYYMAAYSSTSVLVNINETDISLPQGMIMPIKVRSIVPTPGVFLLGENKNVYDGGTRLPN